MTIKRASFSEMLEHYQTICITTQNLASSYSLSREPQISHKINTSNLYKNTRKSSGYTTTRDSVSAFLYETLIPLTLEFSCSLAH